MSSTDVRGASRETEARAFGEFLVADGLLHAEALRQALDTQSTTGGRLDTVLLEMNLVGETVLLDALGRYHATRTVTSADLAVIPPEVTRMISPRMAIRLEIIPFRLEGRTLSVATLRPDDLMVEDELSLLTDCMIASFVTLEVRLYEALSRMYDVEPSIQIASILNREAVPPPDPEVTMAGWDAVEETARPKPPISISNISESATAPAPRYPQAPPEAVALEISEEELSQFPSLRENVDAVPKSVERLHARPADTPSPADPEQRLQNATVAFQNAEMREDIADAVLDFCASILSRRMLLFVRNDAVIGWRGEGDGIDTSVVRKIEIPLTEPSVFVGLSQGAEFWLGPIPRMPRNQDLIRGLGGVPPAECIILPLIVRGKTVCFLYGDNLEKPVSGLPISQLRRLVAKASLAFQVYILKSKIRNL
jgi:hypothetical protein